MIMFAAKYSRGKNSFTNKTLATSHEDSMQYMKRIIKESAHVAWQAMKI